MSLWLSVYLYGAVVVVVVVVQDADAVVVIVVIVVQCCYFQFIVVGVILSLLSLATVVAAAGYGCRLTQTLTSVVTLLADIACCGPYKRCFRRSNSHRLVPCASASSESICAF